MIYDYACFNRAKSKAFHSNLSADNKYNSLSCAIWYVVINISGMHYTSSPWVNGWSYSGGTNYFAWGGEPGIRPCLWP